MENHARRVKVLLGAKMLPLCNHLSNWVFEKSCFGNFLDSFSTPDSFHYFNQVTFCFLLIEEYMNI